MFKLEQLELLAVKPSLKQLLVEEPGLKLELKSNFRQEQLIQLARQLELMEQRPKVRIKFESKS